MTPAEFRAWARMQTERYELLDGSPVEMAAERIGHTAAKSEIYFQLRSQIRPGAPCRPFGDGLSVEVDGSNFEPDASVFCGEVSPDQMAVQDFTLIFEVLSPSTAAYGAAQRAPRYLTLPSIIAVILIDLDNESVFVMRPGKPGAEELGPGDTLNFELPSGMITIDLRPIFQA